ncbi:sugar phosphate isomerase/epimerase family protein [Blastopirellula marina]|uniref:Xylose isomerase-like TIM barrel domain-containing protein n=1 Tax=Blastopirellula marina DSM 3645 TaxID=314230 RepID=A3ZY87_9BACT|nr:sugar phosphate isomerase/epimerase family protein [Blastopirellula marina]EAQ78563.1 hypothetical protein DSM3645_26809 [Blastopirellula marina DSM 3645]
MLTGISYWSMPDGLAGTCDIATALQLAKQHQFDALELAISPGGTLHVDLSQAECEQIRREIEDSGVIVETIASGMSWGCNPASHDEGIRRLAIELHEKALQRAAWLGCQAMLFVPAIVTSPISPGERVRYDHAYQRAEVAVRRLLETAEKVGVDLCVENVWNGFLYSPLELRDFVDSFASDRLGVYFDAGNLLGYQQYPPDWIHLLGSRIKRVHVKGYRDQFDFCGSYEFCELDEGDVPLVETIAALCDIGYDSTIVAEMLPFKEDRLRRTAAALNGLVRQVAA